MPNSNPNRQQVRNEHNPLLFPSYPYQTSRHNTNPFYYQGEPGRNQDQLLLIDNNEHQQQNISQVQRNPNEETDESDANLIERTREDINPESLLERHKRKIPFCVRFSITIVLISVIIIIWYFVLKV